MVRNNRQEEEEGLKLSVIITFNKHFGEKNHKLFSLDSINSIKL